MKFQLSICFKIYVEFDRYGGQVPGFEIFRLNESLPSLSYLCKIFERQLMYSDLKQIFIFHISVKNGKTTYFDGIESFHTYKKYNLRNRWTSFCMSLDLKNDTWKQYINGNGNLTYVNSKKRYNYQMKSVLLYFLS